jgi:hypothetical protein
MNACGICQVAGITLFGGQRDYLASKPHDHASTCWRDRNAADVLASLCVSRTKFEQVGRYSHGQFLAAAFSRIEHMKKSSLLIDNPSVPRGGIQHWKVTMLGELLDHPAFWIKGEQVELSIAVRAEIHRVPHPHRIRIVATAFRLWDFVCGVIAERIQ